MALIGALRSGFVGWHCSRWKEIFTGECGATYSEGEVQECPKNGWPPDFWQAELSHDNDAWEGNYFISRGTVSMLSAPHKVRVWMASNNDTLADWCRVAEGVELSWTDASGLLAGPGWQVWDPSKGARTRKLPVWKYEAAVIEMIAVALSAPDIFTSKVAIFERLHEAFDTYGSVPDEKDIGRLTNRIWQAAQSELIDGSPSD